MQMKKVVVISMLAAAIGTTAVTPVMAQTNAASQTQQALQIKNATFTVNGKAVAIRTINKSGTTLVSVRDIALAIGAEISVSKGVINVQLNHKSATLTGSAVTSVGGNSFTEPKALLEKLGATYVAGSNVVTSFKLLADIEQAAWINPSTLLASKSVEGGREDYLIDTATGRSELLLASSNTSDLVISNDGAKAAYTDENGAVYVITLATKQTVQASTDSSIKNELQWSADGSALFFLQGDKNSVIAKVDLADGKVTKVLEDKVDYKADLSVSSDGGKFAFTVNKQPKVTADAGKDVSLDDVAIDATGTEPQLYFYDAAKADNKPVQLTNDKTDKAFIQISADGSKAYFVSLGDDANSTGTLEVVDIAGKTVKPLFSEQDVYQLTAKGNKLYLLTAKGDSNAIYNIDAASGAATLLHSVSDGVSEIIVSNNGQLAAISNGLLAVAINGKFTTITK
ncbi:stalk domain-containing protein [Paenibacillus gorillae]|uniref:stalk domain-containing protein n=1 Tax=Paenibacillus gorillae TaxID=1243662 RepID=UPI0004AEF50C|nr:stalk domain-containing protein [Paenibacillus gorillae]